MNYVVRRTGDGDYYLVPVNQIQEFNMWIANEWADGGAPPAGIEWVNLASLIITGFIKRP